MRMMIMNMMMMMKIDQMTINRQCARIIARQATVEAEMGGEKPALSFGETRKSFKRGVKSSNWEAFKKKNLSVRFYYRFLCVKGTYLTYLDDVRPL